MTSHHQPHLVIDNTHRVVVAPVDYDRSPEPDTPIVFTGAEVIFAAWAGGVVGSFLTVALAFVWSWFA